MNNFNFFIPTQIRFGVGRITEIPDIISDMGTKCLLVSSANNGTQSQIYNKVKQLLAEKGITIFHYDGVIPNPTTECVEEGIKIALENRVDCVLSIGGGSTMDTGKLIALLYSKTGKVNWDKTIEDYSNPFKISDTPAAALPFIAITTTSGTGSHVTQAAVVTDSLKKEKITVFHSANFPKYAIIDPELTLSVPAEITAATGFDAFSHAFESFQGNFTSPLTETMSLQAIKLIFKYLPIAVANPTNIEARTQLAWADTLAGMCLATGGADLPHPLGEIIGGIAPRVAHGDTLAIVYPEYLKYKKNISTEKFAKVARVINIKAEAMTIEEAAKNLCSEVNQLIEKVKLSEALKKSNLSDEEVKLITNHPLLEKLDVKRTIEIKSIIINSLKK